ncbi:peptidase C39 family protein [Leucobacter sp. M11]|uniref:peptidase C39 family protein n=1 Tax=Leucobacter sp. M11 TaxID=2993565 RepID=UPI002D7F2E0C|nr:peptidase C39 family protein [Leucobacter sp. M11]MEB4615229.1 peptidase C39 family protein [Leucobacter sp. M11]
MTEVTVRTITAAAPSLPEPLAAGLPPERAELWSVERAFWTPEVHVAEDAAGTAVGALLIAGRPLTSSRTVVDVIAPDATVFERLLGAAVTGASEGGALAVKFTERPELAPLDADSRAALSRLGFKQDQVPVFSVPSTRGAVLGWSRWAGARPSRTIPYYGQTTDVTCGAVTALMSLEAGGAGTFGPTSGDANHAAEIAFWRTATNLPAVEPVSLAVSTAQATSALGLPFGTPTVFLSEPGPVLLEWYRDQPHELTLRTQLQADSLRTAQELGIEIRREWLSTEDLVRAVAAGNDVFLLIDLDPLIQDPTPHWVLASEVLDGHVIVFDPWVESEHGETWVDSHALPLPAATVDRITRWGDPAYRGVVVVPRLTS